MAANLSREGVVRDEKGEVYLPATQRPDGSWRKPRRVKDGYVPQEEMPKYENKGVQWMKSKPACPGLTFVDMSENSQSGIPGQNASMENASMSKAAKKNAKRKEKKRQQKEEQGDVEAITSVLERAKIGYKGPRLPPASGDPEGQKDPAKRLKNLRKKYRQIEDLEAKIASGELKNPEKDQLEKISKKQEIAEEIENLELSIEN